MRILVLDTETTGLSPANANMTEVAACVYHVESKAILQTYQTLIYSATNETAEITGITQESLNEMQNIAFNPNSIVALSNRCDALMAHNAQFDRGFIEKYCGIINKPWICSQRHIRFPKEGKSKRLGHICVDHGIPVLSAHRALTDVMLLVQLLNITPNLIDQLNKILSGQGIQLYQAVVPISDKEKAKAAGFTWNSGAKRWEKEMFADEIANLGFPVKAIME